MDKLKKRLNEVETSIEKVNDSLCEMRAGRRLPFYIPSSPSQIYQYLPMKADREIRLLYLDPGSSKSRLACSLKIVPLSKTPIYEALSYTWGKLVFPASMKCSPSGQLCITENLNVALCHLRLKDRIRVLWVDAICINQQDIVERSQQVSLMREIYEGADHVIVWLGKDNGNAKLAFERLQDVPEYTDRVWKPGVFGVLTRVRGPEAEAALVNLLKRGWFQRIWVIQELVCARKATIMCGNQSMEWVRFQGFVGMLYAVGNYNRKGVNDPVYNLIQMRHENERRRLGKQSSLLYLLSAFRSCEASDPRDKIFALVGIADQQTTAACTPDYSKDVFEICRNLASHLIITERNADILAFCVAPHKGQYLPLPSWVPDWSRPQINNASPQSMPGAYNASAGTSLKGRIDSNTLSLDGVMLNRVVILDGGEESYRIFKQSRNYAQRDLTAYVRTLVANVGDEHRLDRQQLLLVCTRYYKDTLIMTDIRNREFFDTWPKFLTTEIKDFYNNSHDPKNRTIEGNLQNALHDAAIGRTFCLFDDRRVGWVPRSAKVGDRIAIFLGGTVPILLRPSGNDYNVLGEAYVDEMMDGQLFEEPDVQVETITLV